MPADAAPISPQRADLVRQSWARILPERKPVCRAFYRRLFDRHPDLQRLFKGDIEHQADLFTTMINTAISALENPTPVRTLIETLGARHADYGVDADDYVKFETVLLDTLAEALGDDFDADTRAAWREVFERLAETMQAGARH